MSRMKRTRLERRTPLVSVTPLQRTPFTPTVVTLARTPMPARTAPLRGHGQSRRDDRQDPGFPNEVEAVILRRDYARFGGCVLAGWGDCWGLLVAHHRQLVGMGGTSLPGTHVPSNGLGACQGHHDWAHNNSLAARQYGLIVSRGRVHPSRARLSVDKGETWMWLTDDGGIRDRPPGGDAA